MNESCTTSVTLIVCGLLSAADAMTGTVAVYVPDARPIAVTLSVITAVALRLEQLGRSGTVAGAGEFLHALQQEIELLVQSLRAMVERMANDRQTNDPRTNDQRMNDPRMTGDL